MLANKATGAKSIENSLYAVIAPGTYTLKVDYTVFDTKTNEEKKITKYYKEHNFDANKICDIPVCLGSTDFYSGYNYYMWDAAKNYWYGHEWDTSDSWQPTEKNGRNGNYPKSKAADGARWYNEGTGPLEPSVNPLFKQLPNANEIGWYVKKGDAHWDNSTQWTAFGKTYTGGIWLKKLSVIAQENGKEPADLKLKDSMGNNLLTSSDYYTGSIKSGKPADSEISKYFFLPALGCYFSGRLFGLGSNGMYWSSSATPSYSSRAYGMDFGRGFVRLNYSLCSDGVVAQPFE